MIVVFRFLYLHPNAATVYPSVKSDTNPHFKRDYWQSTTFDFNNERTPTLNTWFGHDTSEATLKSHC